MPYLLAALSMFALFPLGHRAPAQTSVYESGRWRLEILRDAFRHEVRCRIADDYGHFPRVIAEPQALLLRLPRDTDGSTAWFSVDGAPAKPWRDVEASLIAEGSMVKAERLDNATAGRLPLPYASVGQGDLVVVQLSSGRRLYRYYLAGLWPILRSGEQLGCHFSR